jgi:hypothetical protein
MDNEQDNAAVTPPAENAPASAPETPEGPSTSELNLSGLGQGHALYQAFARLVHPHDPELAEKALPFNPDLLLPGDVVYALKRMTFDLALSTAGGLPNLIPLVPLVGTAVIGLQELLAHGPIQAAADAGVLRPDVVHLLLAHECLKAYEAQLGGIPDESDPVQLTPEQKRHLELEALLHNPEVRARIAEAGVSGAFVILDRSTGEHRVIITEADIPEDLDPEARTMVVNQLRDRDRNDAIPPPQPGSGTLGKKPPKGFPIN